MSTSPNKDKPDNADKTKSELGDEFEDMNSPRMCNILISSLCISSFFSSFSESTNTITLKLPDIYLSFDFEI